MNIVKIIISISLLIGAINSVNAALISHWEFTDPTPVIGPNQTLELNATIYNSISSDTRLVSGNQLISGDIGGVIASTGYGWGSLIFNSSFAPDNPYTTIGNADFTGLDLAPGESFDFVFRTLVPNSYPVQEGVYTFNPQITIRIQDGIFPNGFYDWLIANPAADPNDYPGYQAPEAFTISPSSPLYVTVTSVPLPGALYLFISGFIMILKIQSRKKASYS